MSGSLRRAHVLQAAIVAAICASSLATPGLAQAVGVDGGASNGPATLVSARQAHLTLAPAGSQLYPDTGNGGYVSKHTSVHMVYNSATNRFLPGNHVVLTDVATQCLTSFGLDFERTSANKSDGPRLTVTRVTVNGVARVLRRSCSPPTQVTRRARPTRTRLRTRHRRRTRWVARSTTRCRPHARRSCCRPVRTLTRSTGHSAPLTSLSSPPASRSTAARGSQCR